MSEFYSARKQAEAERLLVNRVQCDRVRDAFKTQTLLTQEQQRLLDSYFSPRRIYSDGSRFSSHPIMKTLCEYANKHLSKFRTASTLEIGADMRLPLGELGHATYISSDVRDNSRHVQHVLNIQKREQITQMQDEYQKSWNAQEYLCTNNKVCFNGVENCRFQCTEILGVCSTQDISMNDWCQIFYNSGAAVAHIWMMLPQELVYPGVKIAENEYILEYSNENGKFTDDPPVNKDGKLDLDKVKEISFRFANDASFAYIHNAKVWCEYYSSNIAQRKINGDVITLLFERVDTVGPMAHITITRTHGVGRIINTALVHNAGRVYIPDIMRILETGEVTLKGGINAQATHVNAIMSYALSCSPTAFNQNSIMIYARGRQHKLRIGPVDVDQSWNVDEATFEEIVTRCVIIAMLRRTVVSKNVGSAATIIKEVSSFWDDKYQLTRDIRVQDFCAKFSMLWRRIEYALANLVHPGRWKIKHWVYYSKPTDLMSLTIMPLPNYPIDNKCVKPSAKFVVKPPTKITNLKRESDKWYAAYIELKEAWFKSDFPPSQRCVDVITKFSYVQPNVHFVVGAPGCGKSHFTRASFDTKKTLIIVPVVKLLDDYQPKFVATTHHEAILKDHVGRYSTIVIDEAFMFHPGYIVMVQMLNPKAEIWCVGDDKQIPYIDFEKLMPLEPMKMVDFVVDPKRLDNCYRFGYNLVHEINRRFDTHMIAKVMKETKIRWFNQQPTQQQIDSYRGQVLVFTQANKVKYPGSMTVHEAQGSTFHSVVLVVNKNDKPLLQSPSHWYVAFTRCREELTVFASVEVPQVFNLSESYLLALELANNVPAPITRPADYKVESEDVEWERPSHHLMGPAAIDDLIEKVTLTYEGLSRIEYTAIPTCQETATITDNVGAEDGLESVTHMKGLRASHDTRIKSTSVSLYTVIKRYGKFTRELTWQETEMEAHDMYRAFTEAYVEEYHQITIDGLDEATFDMISKQVLKGTDRQVKPDIDTIGATAVEFFLKQQSKVKTSAEDGYEQCIGGLFKDKAGQGVSAWSKLLNTLISPYIRASTDAINASLRDNVIYANGDRDERLVHPIDVNENYLTIEGDIEEFDCNQSEITRLFARQLLLGVGVPNWVLDLIDYMMKEWKLSLRTTFELLGHHKKHSGSPQTLSDNSYVTMALYARIVKNIRNAYCAFKGDDAIFIGPDIEFNDFEVHQFEILNLKVKKVMEKPPQFINNFITPAGLVPDLVRRAVKVKSKPLYSAYGNIKENKRIRLSQQRNTSKFCTDLDSSLPAVNKLDLSAIHDLVYNLKQTMPNENCVWHFVNVSKLQDPRNYKAFNAMLKLYDIKKVVLHLSAMADTNRLSEVRLAVDDFLKVLNRRDKFEAAIICASKYYDLTQAEVEKFYAWLNGIAHASNAELADYYVSEELPIITKELDRGTLQDGYFTIKCKFVNCGGDGDCFWRVLWRLVERGDFTRNDYATLQGLMPDKWVQTFDIIDAFNRINLPYSILIYNAINQDNYVLTNDPGSKPNIVLDVKGEHYLMIEDGDLEIEYFPLICGPQIIDRNYLTFEKLLDELNKKELLDQLQSKICLQRYEIGLDSYSDILAEFNIIENMHYVCISQNQHKFVLVKDGENINKNKENVSSKDEKVEDDEEREYTFKETCEQHASKAWRGHTNIHGANWLDWQQWEDCSLGTGSISVSEHNLCNDGSNLQQLSDQSRKSNVHPTSKSVQCGVTGMLLDNWRSECNPTEERRRNIKSSDCITGAQDIFKQKLFNETSSTAQQQTNLPDRQRGWRGSRISVRESIKSTDSDPQCVKRRSPIWNRNCASDSGLFKPRRSKSQSFRDTRSLRNEPRGMEYSRNNNSVHRTIDQIIHDEFVRQVAVSNNSELCSRCSQERLGSDQSRHYLSSISTEDLEKELLFRKRSSAKRSRRQCNNTNSDKMGRQQQGVGDRRTIKSGNCDKHSGVNTPDGVSPRFDKDNQSRQNSRRENKRQGRQDNGTVESYTMQQRRRGDYRDGQVEGRSGRRQGRNNATDKSDPKRLQRRTDINKGQSVTGCVIDGQRRRSVNSDKRSCASGRPEQGNSRRRQGNGTNSQGGYSESTNSSDRIQRSRRKNIGSVGASDSCSSRGTIRGIVIRGGKINMKHPPMAIMHCIAADAKMGKGFAKEVVQRFPDIRSLLPRTLEVGKCYMTRHGKFTVFNLVTKPISAKPPRDDKGLRKALDHMTDIIRHEKKQGRRYVVHSPMIGSGLDQLSFRDVTILLTKAAFEGTDIVYHVLTRAQYNNACLYAGLYVKEYALKPNEVSVFEESGNRMNAYIDLSNV
ncbi:MAG: helicase [Hangzhou hepevirus 1]|nr:MAG: helicase [Hangzhou hepevirus 1]